MQIQDESKPVTEQVDLKAIMLGLSSQCAYFPVLTTLSLLLSSVYFRMTDEYSLVSCISYGVDHPLSICNSPPVLQRTAAEQI